MRLNELSDNNKAYVRRRRSGRGIGSGRGKTCGRGMNGQKSRSGVALNGYEGGQMPIYRRLPKRGFSNKRFGSKLNIVSLGRLQTAIDSKRLDEKSVVNSEALIKAGIIRRELDGFRVLSDGELKVGLKIEGVGISGEALKKLEKAGGSFTSTVVEKEKPAKKEKKDKKTKVEVEASDDSDTDNTSGSSATDVTDSSATTSGDSASDEVKKNGSPKESESETEKE